MVGELIQGQLDEIRNENDASDPVNTVLGFMGAGASLWAMGEVLEIAGGIGDGLAGFVATPEVAPTMALAPNATLNTMPSAPSPGGMGGMS